MPNGTIFHTAGTSWRGLLTSLHLSLVKAVTQRHGQVNPFGNVTGCEHPVG